MCWVHAVICALREIMGRVGDREWTWRSGKCGPNLGLMGIQKNFLKGSDINTKPEVRLGLTLLEFEARVSNHISVKLFFFSNKIVPFSYALQAEKFGSKHGISSSIHHAWFMAIVMWIANDVKMCKVLNLMKKKQLDDPDIHYPVKLNF